MAASDARRRSNVSAELLELFRTDQQLSFKKFEDDLFDVLSDGAERVAISRLLRHLRSVGLWDRDPRLKETITKIKEMTTTLTGDVELADRELMVDRETFDDIIKCNITLIQKAFTQELVVPEFREFVNKLNEIYYECKVKTDGEVASYIPQLKRFSPGYWGMSVCTVDGQRHSNGDVNIPFPIQSSSKPLSYALVLRDLGEERVHKHIGHEPSGESFNHIKLGHGNKPHNPMINAGAIVTASLLRNDLCLADRFDYVFSQFKKMAGEEQVGFNNAVFLSERETADRNFALAYYMNENKCFPEGSRIQEVLDFYFMLCSIEMTVESAAVVAATLANGGLCPTTGEQVLDAVSVRNTLSLMHSCGMYDYSGEFAFKVGLPAKSGVSGVILLVIPNVAGICVWSPPLDSFGNSVRGIEFSQKLVKTFNFHHYDSLKHDLSKTDPRVRPSEVEGSYVVHLLFAACNGDITALRRMTLGGKTMTASDYDGRTALHLSTSEGHYDCVKFLVDKCDVELCPKDRWGHTPLDDAKIFGHQEIAKFLEEKINAQASNDTAPSTGEATN